MKKINLWLLSLTATLALVGCVVPSSSQNDSNTPSTSEKPGESISTNNGCDIHMDDDANNICDICGNILIEYDYSCDGLYTLEQMSVSNVDVTGTYYENYMILNEGEVQWVKTSLIGKEVTEATYEKEDEVVTIKVGIMPYTFTYDKDANSLNFNGTMNKKKVKMTYSKNDYSIKDSKGEVDFTDELFGDDINENFYNYCPTIMMEGNDTMHIWYCSNEISGNVTDYVAYRKGTLHADGKWTFTEKQLVLGPGEEGEWDSRHACDPSVVKGKFNYNNKQYNYLMAYLGCYTSNVTCNEVGIAVAEKPEGPWIKVKEINPIANYYESTDFGSDGNTFWGYGQPSLVSVDKEGKILLFYTKGVKLGTFTYVEKWDLSNLNSPLKLDEGKLTDGGSIGVFNNADFAYDPINKRIYTVKEDHDNGWYPTDGGVNWISGSNSVYYTSMSTTDEEAGDTLFKTHTWAKVNTIGKAATGYDRVHNSGIVTDEYGWIVNYEKIPVVYTMSKLATDYPDWEAKGQWPALHTYRLHGFVVEI